MPEAKQARPGRPRRAAKRAIQTTIYVDQDTLDVVDEAATETGISRSEWVNQAIREKMDRDGLKLPEE